MSEKKEPLGVVEQVFANQIQSQLGLIQNAIKTMFGKPIKVTILIKYEESVGGDKSILFTDDSYEEIRKCLSWLVKKGHMQKVDKK